jgi:hypothetical protein
MTLLIRLHIISILFFMGSCATQAPQKTTTTDPKTNPNNKTTTTDPKTNPKTTTTDPKTNPKTTTTKPNVSNFDVYTIAQGSQRATIGFDIFDQNVMKFEVMFDESAKYKTSDPSNQADINKLYVFSDCFSSHQQNSARFGWRWYNDRLELLAYCYQGGQRNEELLVSAIELNKIYLCEIEAKADKYIFKLNGITKEAQRGCSDTPSGYKLYPYFGGDEYAPQEIKIWIRDL